MSRILRTWTTFSQVALTLPFPSAIRKVPNSLHPPQHVLPSAVSLELPPWVWRESMCGLDLYFLNNEWGGTSSCGLISHYTYIIQNIFSLEKCSWPELKARARGTLNQWGYPRPPRGWYSSWTGSNAPLSAKLWLLASTPKSWGGEEEGRAELTADHGSESSVHGQFSALSFASVSHQNSKVVYFSCFAGIFIVLEEKQVHWDIHWHSRSESMIIHQETGIRRKHGVFKILANALWENFWEFCII